MQESGYKNDEDREYATNLRCKVCAQFREHIEGIQYSKEDWIAGSTNYCLSNTTDHAKGVSHKETMEHYCKSVGKTHVEKEIIISNQKKVVWLE